MYRAMYHRYASVLADPGEVMVVPGMIPCPVNMDSPLSRNSHIFTGIRGPSNTRRLYKLPSVVSYRIAISRSAPAMEDATLLVAATSGSYTTAPSMNERYAFTTSSGD